MKNVIHKHITFSKTSKGMNNLNNFIDHQLDLIHSSRYCAFANQNIIFLNSFKKHMLVCSLEVPLWGASNEYPQHTFLKRNRKDIFLIPSLIWISDTPSYLELCYQKWHSELWYYMTILMWKDTCWWELLWVLLSDGGVYLNIWPILLLW